MPKLFCPILELINDLYFTDLLLFPQLSIDTTFYWICILNAYNFIDTSLLVYSNYISAVIIIIVGGKGYSLFNLVF